MDFSACAGGSVCRGTVYLQGEIDVDCGVGLARVLCAGRGGPPASCFKCSCGGSSIQCPFVSICCGGFTCNEKMLTLHGIRGIFYIIRICSLWVSVRC